MPAEVTHEPLGIACTFSDGTSARFALGGLPCRELAEDLLTGLAELVHPHGTVDAAGSVEHYVASVRHMARQLDAAGFSGGASGLRRAQAARYWMAAPGPREACTRRMLLGFQAAGGTLDAGLAELAAGRAFNPQRNRRQLPPYSEGEWARLASACEAVSGESFAAHKQALAAAGRGRHPREHGWSGDNLRWLLARTGPVGIVAFGEHLGCSENVVRQRGGVLEASRDLFPGLDAVIAYRLLFGIYSGIVPDGIDDLTTGDIDWAGDSVILLSYVKGRTAAESLNLPRRAVRLLEQWLSRSALLRSHASPECRGDLWLRLNKPGGTRIWDRGGAAGRAAVQRWIERHGVTGDDGGPLKVHRSRIRTTHQSMRDKRAWAGRGRATIDPNHSPEVEGDHYLTATTPSQRQAAEAIVEDAQHDLLRRALPPTVVSAEDAASLARGYPEPVASLGLDGTVIAELAGGERDVFTAACAGQLSGLHGPAGKPCPARPWVCLLCPLAVFAPRHAPNLLRLKAFFSRQWQQMPAAQFMAVFGPYSQRAGQVLDRFDPAVVARAAASVGDHDGEIPLRPEEAHQMTTALAGAAGPRQSPFTGADVCREAGLVLPGGTARPVFDDDLWDFTEVAGLPNQMAKVNRRFDFAAITRPGWRLVAREQIMAMLAPRHEAVIVLPHAYRTPLHLTTAFARLAELTRLLNWLAGQDVASLADIDDERCEAWMAHRRYLLDENGNVAGERSPATRRAAAQAVADLVTHRDLFTADTVAAGLRPWRGAAPSVVAEMPHGARQNKTPPVSGSVLQPLLAAALYLTGTVGPHAPGLLGQVRDSDRRWSVKHGDHVLSAALPAGQITRVLEGYEQRGEPLPLADEHVIRNRQQAGWSPGDPLARLSLGLIARQAGFTQFWRQWIPDMRSRIEEALDIVGAEKPFGRGSPAVDRADGEGTVPWTLPLDRLEAVALVGIVRTASIALLAVVSGMRSSELMELETGCCRPPEHYGDGLVRYRLASKVVKGQPLGGTPDEWVVIEPAYQAAQLLVRLHDDPRPGNPLLGRFAFDVRWTWFRNWVNGPSGQRLGLAPVPDDPLSLRALRRTLAIELAYRPGGVLATKLHLKHIAVATTEGYASRPGGAQAELLAEVNKHESERNLALVWDELRNYQQGIMPAGPGARELTEFFAHVDGKIAAGDPGTPKAQASDRDVLNLMAKRAATLHLGTANYCWFTDPSRALCLRLAGTPAADKPLIGMCDSARCPQATHHPCHRPVWAEHAENTKTFLGQLGRPQKAERKRLEAEYDRAVRVLERIDEAAAAAETR